MTDQENNAVPDDYVQHIKTEDREKAPDEMILS